MVYNHSAINNLGQFVKGEKMNDLRRCIYFRQCHRDNTYIFTRNQQGGIK